ncbi:signal peptide peptidase SppA [Sediminibacillus albus]|uniref:Protease-4 n=1 Tax=Sediminibacillus albus TaxID=407036 RepID=A0A1G8YQG4_9BACI|nr:signal peptide peptidase SppA [Sediminibacillus albus]SDK05023.1 protease-4 [Sediminibacillus albus]
MNGKRWLALGIAAGLFLVSIGFQFVSSLASTNLDGVFSQKEEMFDETVLEEGSGNSKIAVLNLEGVIQDTGSGSLLNTSGYDHQHFLKMIEKAGEDNSVDGIILRVNTPGGGVVESAEIHDKIVEIQEEKDKPVYVSMGNTAASGGYYVSAPAEKIVANSATLTGSIGVIMESINYAELADEYGIDFNTIKSGKYKDIMSGSREMTDEEEEILQTMVDELYGEFVQVIVEGRGMEEDRVRELGDGRVYTGKQALENQLIDDLGTLDDTIAMMEEDYDLDGAQVIQYRAGFNFDQFLGMTAQNLFGSNLELVGIQELIRESDGPRAMYLYSR